MKMLAMYINMEMYMRICENIIFLTRVKRVWEAVSVYEAERNQKQKKERMCAGAGRARTIGNINFLPWFVGGKV